MKLKKGMNLGGFLSQCRHSHEHYETFIVKEDISRIAGWGMDHVRLPIDYEVFEDPKGFDIVRKVVEWSKEYGLNIILDLHKAPGYDFNNAGDKDRNNLFSSEELQERFIGLWVMIAKEFGACEHVAFELLNEVVEEDNAELWNKLIKRSVTAIREITKERPIIYGGIRWNSAETLQFLEKPLDENIILTFHFYDPMIFTHQKAPWMTANIVQDMEVSYPGDMDFYRRESKKMGIQGMPVYRAKADNIGADYLKEMMGSAVEAAAKLGAPLYCGEFGVIERAPVQDTLRWFQTVDEVFRFYDIGFGVWTYRKMDFGIMNEHYDEIREELIRLWSK